LGGGQLQGDPAECPPARPTRRDQHRRLSSDLASRPCAECRPASGARFALLPPDNATSNFTKVVQRVMARVSLENVPAALQGRLVPPSPLLAGSAAAQASATQFGPSSALARRAANRNAVASQPLPPRNLCD
jgi:hypothetical protein